MRYSQSKGKIEVNRVLPHSFVQVLYILFCIVSLHPFESLEIPIILIEMVEVWDISNKRVTLKRIEFICASTMSQVSHPLSYYCPTYRLIRHINTYNKAH